MWQYTRRKAEGKIDRRYLAVPLKDGANKGKLV